MRAIICRFKKQNKNHAKAQDYPHKIHIHPHRQKGHKCKNLSTKTQNPQSQNLTQNPPRKQNLTKQTTHKDATVS